MARLERIFQALTRADCPILRRVSDMRTGLQEARCSVQQPGAVQTLHRSHSDISSICVGDIQYCDSNMQYAGKQLFADGSMPTVQSAIAFAQELHLGTKQTEHTTCAALLEHATAILKQKPNVQTIEPKPFHDIVIVGDLHGGFGDLIAIFELNGWPSRKVTYVFNGDFVDRGPQGVEILLVLMAFVIALPDGVLLNRGNHEDELICKSYSFQEECCEKQGEQVFNGFCEFFTALPLAVLVKDYCFVVHGGLSRLPATELEDIQAIERGFYATTQARSRPTTNQLP